MTKTCFFNYISTGCTCCSDENFCEGPFESLDDALASAESHYNWRTLCSQYADNGHQETYSAECRILTDPETGEQFILIPDGPWATEFGGNRLPADTRYGDGFEYLGPLHARLAPARQFYVYP